MSSRCIEDTGGVFHPKVVVGLRGHEARTLIWVEHLYQRLVLRQHRDERVHGGLASESPFAEVLAFLDRQWASSAFEPDEDW